jgi:DNA helicase-2/ATP-dependent DNA helicase PcrA
MEFLSDLNPQQRQAVTAGAGPILVLAGPGSGKTRVLTHRIAYLIAYEGVRPYNILAVTFTNKAANEMKARIERLLGKPAQSVNMGTFHALCARWLRREAELLPVNSNYVIFDEDDQLAVVKHALRDLNLDEKQYRPAAVLNAISRAKNDLLGPDEFPIQSYRDEVVARVYRRYQELLVASNAVDFDDLLLYAARLLQDQPSVRERYARRYEHILVDEFQDTNYAQYQLLKLLGSVHRNIFAVGDEDQSIYRWRGADYRNIQRFEQDYPDAKKILLEHNYRSTQTVLDLARAVIDPNPYRTPKRLFSDRGQGEKVSLYEAVDDYGEAEYVVDTIVNLIGRHKASPGDIAVMYRTNAQSRLLEEAFLRAGLPYRLVGAQRFYGRREVKDVIAYLRLAHNPDDMVSLERVINVPPRGIGDKTLTALRVEAQRTGISAGRLLMELGTSEKSPYREAFSLRGGAVLADFGGKLAGWLAARDELPLPALFDRILADVGYREYIDDGSEEGADRWANVEQLRALAYDYRDRGLADFLETVALVSDQDTLPENGGAPTLMTLHAAKGLEFPVVFITGLDEGLLPHSRARDDPEEMAEERRLLYVGVTRAKDRLYLVRADRRATYGPPEETIASRFLDDIPEELLAGRHTRVRSFSSGRSARRSHSLTWEQAATPSARRGSAPILQSRYRPSMRVRHPVWGDGMVVESRIEDGDETVDVIFESAGFKRVAASIANLEILGESKET